ncbi:MAG: sugar ABC transporter substrate-binding protein [Spirochaetaceae bacterium]|jgi:multiple sugar transport system substrate-binding protein|nr:sugar ABC transporter substrate-binding protein [Spirochaetaceae bacterium]
MHFKKTAAAVLACLALFSACSKKGGSGESVESATGPFDWQRAKGTEITVWMVQHSTTDALQQQINDFQNLTGIKVNVSVTPEANYFDKVNNALPSKSGTPDVFMTGVYQMWNYATSGFLEGLDPYFANSALVGPDYDYDDFVESVINALRWDGKTGHRGGTGTLWALPLGCEIYSLAYNKPAFEKAGITKPPVTYDELLAVCKKLQGWNGAQSYPLALRGARDWGTIHPAYLSTYANFGAVDFAIEGGKLVSKVNSPESIAMNKFWVELVQTGAAKDWTSKYWYISQSDLGAGIAAMDWDADNTEVLVNLGDYKEKGNIAFTMMPVAKAGDTVKSNFWIWAASMNASSKNKIGAWLFLQYFTGKEFLKSASVQGNNMDPVRTSTWQDPGFQAKMADQEGFISTFNKTSENASILFTPQPAFFETTTEWASALQDMVAGAPVEERLNKLKQFMDAAVADVKVE